MPKRSSDRESIYNRVVVHDEPDDWQRFRRERMWRFDFGYVGDCRTEGERTAFDWFTVIVTFPRGPTRSHGGAAMKRMCLGPGEGIRPPAECPRAIELGQGPRCPYCKRLANRVKNATSPYQTKEWKRLAKQVKVRDVGCRLCGSTRLLAAHHLTPVSRGGTHDPANVVSLCQSHHSEYTNAVRDGKDTPLRRLREGR